MPKATEVTIPLTGGLTRTETRENETVSFRSGRDDAAGVLGKGGSVQVSFTLGEGATASFDKTKDYEVILRPLKG